MKITDQVLKDRILQVIGDPESSRLLQAIRSTPKDAQTLASETGIPLSSVYRKLSAMRSAGLVLTSSFRITPEGKRQDMLSSAVSEVRIGIGDPVEVDLIPTQENAKRMWFDLFSSR